MNWFERYGIVGIFYFALTISWLTSFSFSFFINLNSCHFTSKDISIIIAIGIAAALPAGYLISILSQNIFYNILPEKIQIHKKVCKEIGLSADWADYNEWKLEAYLAVKHRLTSSSSKLENLKWMQEWTRKRWDVFAISFSMITATVLAFITSLILTSSLLVWAPNYQIIMVLSLFSAIVLIILIWSWRLMFSQIVEATKITFREVL